MYDTESGVRGGSRQQGSRVAGRRADAVGSRGIGVVVETLLESRVRGIDATSKQKATGVQGVVYVYESHDLMRHGHAPVSHRYDLMCRRLREMRLVHVYRQWSWKHPIVHS